MRSRRRDRDFQIFSMSFLDCICCAFGALILIMVLTQIGTPQVIEDTEVDMRGLIAQRERELVVLRGEVAALDRRLSGRKEQLSELRARVAQLRAQLDRVQGQFKASTQDAEVAAQLEGKLSVAQQTLSAEMQRLLGQRYQRAKDAPVGGIPVDSEYIIFIVDTSGSMQNYSWRLAEQKLREVLEVYPKVKGIQVLEDEGGYMFGEYRGKWIPDSKERRKVILDRFRNWQSFSNSSPVEGIVAAIRTFWTPEHKISIYVFGDEFTGGSVQQVVEQVDRINRSGRDGGDRLVRIHAIGFPLDPAAPQFTGVRFATLMRIICQRNGGTFVGLTR
ncbi:MAG: VWA domain-containing protein [Gammaproteobacteria bacterium]